MAEPSGNDSGLPTPEVLQPKSDSSSQETVAKPAAAAKPVRRGAYRPSHKATFIGLAVVVVILAINAGIIFIVISKSQSKNSSVPTAQITLDQSTLSKLGVDRTAVQASGLQLVVNPNAKFNGSLQVGGNVSVGGQLNLNSKLTASDASFTQLEAGNTSISSLNVNGDGTLSNLALRGNLGVSGTSQFQGAVTLSQLLTVNNSVNVAGNLSIGGVLAVSAFQVNNLTVGGHLITLGAAPSVSQGSAVGTNGTVSISGNDATGTVAANAGVGAGTGTVACVTFRTAYATIPHVVVSASAPLNTYVSRSTNGFCIYAGNSLSAGVGYAFDYIVEQ